MQQIEDDVLCVDMPHGAEADDFAVKLVACPRGNRAIPIVDMADIRSPIEFRRQRKNGDGIGEEGGCGKDGKTEGIPTGPQLLRQPLMARQPLGELTIKDK